MCTTGIIFGTQIYLYIHYFSMTFAKKHIESAQLEKYYFILNFFWH